MQPAIEVNHLSKTYRLYGNPYNRFLERLPWNRRPRHQAVQALTDITFKVEPGQCVGLIGANGAGKSTMLKILSGTTFPTAGSYTIRGRVASLLELGAGFHQNFTGRENIYMNAAMMGFSRREATKKLQEIVDFSGLGDFINAPIRTYSSGMVARLGFSVAVATDPDVLIIDEILAVGDMSFRRKCVDKIWNYKKRGKTMFFCSHSLYDVRQICDQAIWLRDGKIEMMGDSVLVTNEYATYENRATEGADPVPFDEVPAAPGKGEDQPRILGAVLLDPKTGQRRTKFAPGEDVALRVHVKNAAARERLALAVGVMRKDGTLCFAHSTQMEGRTFDFAEGHVTLVLKGIKLLSGEFTLPIWLLDANGVHRFHERPAEETLVVQNRTADLGLFLQEHEWLFEPLPLASEPADRLRR